MPSPPSNCPKNLTTCYLLPKKSYYLLPATYYQNLTFVPMKKLVYAFWLFSLFTACSTLPTPPAQAQYEMPKQAFSKRGMVVTAHPAASRVGVDILAKGGNAIDAMVAVHFALAVCYQRAGNIGGGGFMLYRPAAGGVVSLDFRETAPAAATRNMYLDEKGNAIDSLSRDGHLAVGTPGSVDGMWQAHQRYGKLSWAEVVQPAINMAANGVLLTNYEASTLNDFRPIFLKVNRYAPAFVQSDSTRLWKKGDTLLQPDLANTFRMIRDAGREGFYAGWVADSIVAEMQAKGGLISHADLANYQSKWREVLQFDYEGYRIYSMPPPSSGGLLLAQFFGMIRPYKLKKYGFHSPAAVHLMAEVMRRAYADRAEYMADPDFYTVPLRQLCDSAYLLQRMADYSPKKASLSADTKAGSLAESEETTHYCITDADGNAVSVTTTVNTNYGAKVVVKGGGFILNNEMDDFAAKPNSPNVFGLLGGDANAIAPNKRMLSSMTPTIVEKNGKLFMLVGTPGGATIPTIVFQVLANVLIFDKPLLEAVHARRFHHQHSPDKIQHEKDALSKSTIRQLRALGHKVEARKSMGLVEAIMIHPDGRQEGVADRRSDDTALGVEVKSEK